MASFTDRIPQFNPYVSQQPVEAMTQVGMAKQQQYNTNLQKIQQSMSNIAGMPIGRDVDKEYLEQKMGDMTDKLNIYASSDLSSARLTTHLRGMVGGIAQDEVVQNSVRSTMAVDSARKLQSKFNSEGKGSPSNDYMLNRQLSEYYNNPEAGAQFSGEYKPFTEYNEPAREIIKGLASDFTNNPVAFDYDENGNVVGVRDAITDTEIEGITPEKIQSALQAQLSPAMLQQMQMDGIYQYSGTTDEQFITATRERYGSVISNYEKELTKLQKLSDKSGASVKDKIQEQIKGIESYIKNVKREFNSIDKQLEEGNLDGAKAKLFTIDWMDNMAQSYSYSKVKTTISNSPYKDVQLKQAKMRQDASIAYAKMQQTDYWKGIEAADRSADRALKRDKLAAEAAEDARTGAEGYGSIIMPTSGDELDNDKYVLQVKESIEEEEQTTKELTDLVLNRHNISPEDLNDQMARAKDLSFPMSMDVRDDLVKLSKQQETYDLKRKQLLKLETNAERLYPTTTTKLIPKSENKTFLAEFPDGTIYEYDTQEMVDFMFSMKDKDTNKIEEELTIDYTKDSAEEIERKKRIAPMMVAYKKRFGSGTTKYVIENEDFTFMNTNGEPINKKSLAFDLASVQRDYTGKFDDNAELKNKYIADGIKNRRAAFNPKGYPISFPDNKAKAAFRSGVLNQLALRAKEGSLENTDVTEGEIMEYSAKLSGAVVGTDGEGNNQVTFFADNKAEGLTVPIVQNDFNALFKGNFQMSPQQETFYNEYLPDLLDYVPEATVALDKFGQPLINPESGAVVYKDNPVNFWTSNTSGDYESNIEEARYKKRDGYFNNVGMFDVSADIVTKQNPSASDSVILKLNIQDPLTGKTFNSITFPSPVPITRIDDYLKREFNDFNLWEMLPGNRGKQMSQEELELRKRALQTGEKN